MVLFTIRKSYLLITYEMVNIGLCVYSNIYIYTYTCICMNERVFGCVYVYIYIYMAHQSVRLLKPLMSNY